MESYSNPMIKNKWVRCVNMLILLLTFHWRGILAFWSDLFPVLVEHFLNRTRNWNLNFFDLTPPRPNSFLVPVFLVESGEHFCDFNHKLSRKKRRKKEKKKHLSESWFKPLISVHLLCFCFLAVIISLPLSIPAILIFSDKQGRSWLFCYMVSNETIFSDKQGR